ncbi:monocarboxylate transporter 9 isoform X1 [Leptinotarsa decemlineata]|uniref:monocarboxylate transporter 9 isoform X1 n=2 Tax=Leptinotarsa decemlineata TaxID=7539 RepID=UPI003D306883
MKKTVRKAPDGGYGWIIVLAASLNGFIGVLSGFSLVLLGSFEHLNLSATQGSFIINLNSGFGMLAGLMNGPLINKFGYRKMSLIGAFFMSAGIFLLTFTESMTGFILAYGLMASIGVVLTRSSYSLAISTYFNEKRNKAFGITMTIAGLGPILMPQLLDLLLESFDTKGAILILSSIYAQTFIAACLLQPVKFHLKEVPDENQKEKLSKIEEVDEEDSALGEDHEVLHEIPKIIVSKIPRVRSNSYVTSRELPFRRKDSIISISYEQEIAGIYGLDTSVMSLEPGAFPTLERQQHTKTKFQWWRSASTVNLESSVNIFEADPKEEKVYNELSEKTKQTSACEQFLKFIVKIFDLTLLKDYTYCSIMLGISLTVFAEIDFSLSLPFMLSEFGMSTTQIAEFLSILGVADIIFRFLASYIGDLLDKSPRVMHLISLMGLIVVRSLISITIEVDYLFALAVALGAAKGIRTVYLSLTLPSYVPLDRLASASGIQLVFNGLFVITGGTFLGYVRDATGDYKGGIFFLNCVTFSVVVLWTIEMIFTRKKSKAEDQEESMKVLSESET